VKVFLAVRVRPSLSLDADKLFFGRLYIDRLYHSRSNYVCGVDVLYIDA